MIKDLTFKTPESAGLSSKKVIDFIKKIKERRINLHSFMIVKDGNILTEAYYKPIDKDFMHRIYSSSKSFVALATGMLIDEGLVKLTDKIVDYFPELVEKELGRDMLECTIEDMLIMAVPMKHETYMNSNEWAWTFFNELPELKPAGTIFCYNTSASFMLNVLVEKLTGKPFLEYMRPVFDKIGVSRDIWCVKSPDGYSWGGSGVICTLRDFAKVGEFVLNKGNCNGEQLISREYMEKMTSVQITTQSGNSNMGSDTTGYGYQLWINPRGYVLHGMGGQMAYCFPEKNFMFVSNGDTMCMGDRTYSILFFLVEEYLYESLADGPLPEDEEAQKTLNEMISTLNLSDIKLGKNESAYENEINGVKFTLRDDNKLGWKWLKLDFNENGGVFTYENSRGVKELTFGRNEYLDQTFPETNEYDVTVHTPCGRGLRCLVSGSWTEEKKFLLRVHFIDTNLGSMYVTLGYKNDEVGILVNRFTEFFLKDYGEWVEYTAAKR